MASYRTQVVWQARQAALISLAIIAASCGGTTTSTTTAVEVSTPLLEHSTFETREHAPEQVEFACDVRDRTFAVSFVNDQSFQAEIDQGSGYEIAGSVGLPGGIGTVSVTGSFETHYAQLWGARVSEGNEVEVTIARGADTVVTYQEITEIAVGSVAVGDGVAELSYPYRVPVSHRFKEPPRVSSESPCDEVFEPIPSNELPRLLDTDESLATARVEAEQLQVDVIPAPDGYNQCRADEDGNPTARAGHVQFAIVGVDPLGRLTDGDVDLIDRPDSVQRGSTVELYLRPDLCVTLITKLIIDDFWAGRARSVPTATAAP